jgi:hypothetical protein
VRYPAMNYRISLMSGRVSLWMTLLAAVAGSAARRAQAAEGAWGVEAGPTATVPPTVGYRFGGEAASFSLALPWSLQFGPALHSDAGEGLRPYRALLEPGLLLPASGGSTSYYIRAGLRRIANTAGFLGFGLGCGYTQSMSKKLKNAISQEVILTLGRCCTPGSLLLSVRYEYSFSGGGEVWTSLGFPLW